MDWNRKIWGSPCIKIWYSIFGDHIGFNYTHTSLINKATDSIIDKPATPLLDTLTQSHQDLICRIQTFKLFKEIIKLCSNEDQTVTA